MHSRGLFGECRLWLDRALAAAPGESSLHARALLINSALTAHQGDTAAAGRLLDDGEDMARRVNASIEIGRALHLRALNAELNNELTRAIELLIEAWTIISADAEHHLELASHVLVTLGLSAGLAGDQEHSALAFRELHAIVTSRSAAPFQVCNTVG